MVVNAPMITLTFFDGLLMVSLYLYSTITLSSLLMIPLLEPFSEIYKLHSLKYQVIESEGDFFAVIK